MSLRTVRAKGFTLVEAIVAIAMVGLAIAGLSSGLAALTQAFRRSIEREEIQRLAQLKLDELIGTGEWISLSDGEFEDERYQDYSWSLASETTEIEGLEYVRLTVTLERNGRTDTDYAEGLAYRATTAVTGGASQ